MSQTKQKPEQERLLTVLQIAPTPFSSDRGCHMRIRGIILALRKKGVHSVLCTYHNGREVDGIETVRTAHIPGYTKAEAGPSAFKYLADILLFFKVCSQILRRRPDVIHAHLHEGALIGWAAKMCMFRKRIPLVFDVQGSLVGELEAHGYFKHFPFLRRIFWAVEYLITRMPQSFACSSEVSAAILFEEFKVRREQIALVPDGTDVRPADPGAVDCLRQELNLPADRMIVVYSGALLKAKGLDTLQAVILEAHRRDLNCHFLIIGYPRENMDRFLVAQDLQTSCTTTGRIPYERLQDYLALAEIAIEPKAGDSSEASGKLLNYMGAGLPVVCFDTENNRRLLGTDGYFVSGVSIKELADQIAAIATAREEARQRGQNGSDRVREQFSWDAGADRILSLYTSDPGILMGIG